MDVMLPEMNGIEAASCIKEIIPDAQILMLSMYEDSAYQSDAATAGAAAYIPKQDGYGIDPRCNEAAVRSGEEIGTCRNREL